MLELLNDDEIRDGLAALQGWEGDTAGIRRQVSAPDFLTGIRIVADVAVDAERLNHHPDIDIRFRTVTFVCSTHTAGGVTARDLELARHIDEIVARETG